MNTIQELQAMQDIIKQNNMTVADYENSIKLIEDKINNNFDIDWADIVSQCGIPFAKDTVRKASSQALYGWVFVAKYMQLREQVKSGVAENQYRSSTSINKDGSIISDKLVSLSEEDLKDPKAILLAHNFDYSQWELINAKHSVWNVYSKSEGMKQLYSSKISVRPRGDISLEEIETFYKYLCETYKPKLNTKQLNKDGNLMLEIPIVDLHFGKTSANNNTFKPYNTEIAKLYFNYIIDYCVQQSANKNIESIIFPIGNDFWHYDTFQCTTTAGTPQSTDRKSQSLFKESIELLIDGITKLSQVAPVQVFYVPGNHDFLTSYHGLMALWCYFHDNPNVIVDTNTYPRKYIEYGNNLLGFAHGDKEKKRISGLMQIEAKESWGHTKYHHWHLGHYHSNHGDEQNGVIITNLPSVTGSDEWHDINGYVGAAQECRCYVWDKNYGLDTIININIEKALQ